jgi:hypothetical protein
MCSNDLSVVLQKTILFCVKRYCMTSQKITRHYTILYDVIEHYTALHDDLHQYVVSVNHHGAEFTEGNIRQKGFQIIDIHVTVVE